MKDHIAKLCQSCYYTSFAKYARFDRPSCHSPIQTLVPAFFQHNFCVKPYVPREPRRDPSPRACRPVSARESDFSNSLLCGTSPYLFLSRSLNLLHVWTSELANMIQSRLQSDETSTGSQVNLIIALPYQMKSVCNIMWTSQRNDDTRHHCSYQFCDTSHCADRQ